MAKKRHDVATRTIRNITFALVPVDEYVELLEIKQHWKERGLGGLKLERRSKSPIDRTPALATFLAERINKMALAEAQEACKAQFGAEATPSISAIQRFWYRIRLDRAVERARANG